MKKRFNKKEPTDVREICINCESNPQTLHHTDKKGGEEI